MWNPRVGGEKLTAAGVVGRGRGSPPHRRGKGVDVAVADTLVGITPAQAGKS